MHTHRTPGSGWAQLSDTCSMHAERWAAGPVVDKADKGP